MIWCGCDCSLQQGYSCWSLMTRILKLHTVCPRHQAIENLSRWIEWDKPGIIGILQTTPASEIHSPWSPFYNKVLQILDLFWGKDIRRGTITFVNSSIHCSKQIPILVIHILEWLYLNISTILPRIFSIMVSSTFNVDEVLVNVVGLRYLKY